MRGDGEFVASVSMQNKVTGLPHDPGSPQRIENKHSNDTLVLERLIVVSACVRACVYSCKEVRRQFLGFGSALPLY